MSYAETVAEDRRLVILRILESAGAYEANESMVGMVLRDFGHAVPRNQVREDFAWLEKAGLVTVEELASVKIAKLTQPGLETSQGIVVTPGVKRPGPG